MKHIYYRELPDCPKCNCEMRLVKYFEGEKTEQHPFGTNPVYKWYCPDCKEYGEKMTEPPKYEYEFIER